MYVRFVILVAVDPSCPNSLRHENVVSETYFETRASSDMSPFIKPLSFFVNLNGASKSTIVARRLL